MSTIDRLVLEEFKAFYREASYYLTPGLKHLLYGFLVWVQDKYLDYRIKVTVDEAIKQYEKEEPKEVPLTAGVYSEAGSGFFDEMRITAKYVYDQQQRDKP